MYVKSLPKILHNQNRFIEICDDWSENIHEYSCLLKDEFDEYPTYFVDGGVEANWKGVDWDSHVVDISEQMKSAPDFGSIKNPVRWSWGERRELR